MEVSGLEELSRSTTITGEQAEVVQSHFFVQSSWR